RGEQIVRDADRVEIAGEMEVDVLHRHDLRVAAAGTAALAAEAGPKRRLANADHRLLADAIQRVAETDGRRRLALPGRGRRDRGDEDQLAVRPVLQPLNEPRGQLCLVVSIRLEVSRIDAKPLLGQLGDPFELGITGYRNVVVHTCLTGTSGAEPNRP